MAVNLNETETEYDAPADAAPLGAPDLGEGLPPPPLARRAGQAGPVGRHGTGHAASRRSAVRARAKPVRRRAIPAHGPAAGRFPRIRSGSVRSVNCPGLRPLSSTSSQVSGVATGAPGRPRTEYGATASWA